MAIYAIGDVQGCDAELCRLLEHIAFDPTQDRLWFTGDLVNRGPDSLAVLRRVRALGDRAVVVLGNHDLHLLAVAAGNLKHADSSLQPILRAPDCDDLLAWLRHRPLLHHDPDRNITLVHAGLPPQWDLAQAQACAQELEAVLHSDGYPDFLRAMYSNEPARWSPGLKGLDRLRFIANSLTRLRFCTADGGLALKEKGPLGSQPPGVLPWFAVPGRRSQALRIVFGHWSTLGYWSGANVWAIDSGCVWGGALTALRLDCWPPCPLHIQCPGYARPGAD
ncbi:symmetrical bis(5'-nucleosyl)-tetraphosphatase [Caldichromatium japonicum]|uniref:Bis(5'-nucleosyl)-tetraphosphatase, symmetrical n=1 Tax=Caldichromatium japonicum TaxID=2699430 RepID=A0A6G7VDP2_9GAMM|nr:symmetrical bis(5'-nucleosyl)-tetraphosphatase [Caldichromatium japonicum]QIK38005.1 symmetrical bis(5'-nucleosyl)-tetraphosphatase [Caldichromatium japonicum]